MERRKGCGLTPLGWLVLIAVIIALAVLVWPKWSRIGPAIGKVADFAVNILERPIPTAVAVLPTPAKPEVTPIPVHPTPIPGEERPTLVVAFDAFGSYFPVIQVAQMSDRVYDLNLVPFLFDGEGGEYDFSEDQRAEKLLSGEWDILFTTADALSRTGNIGVIISVVDQSAGADKVVAWPTAVTQKVSQLQSSTT